MGSVFGLWISKVKGPARNLHILNPEVVLVPIWGATFGNKWEYYGLPLSSCVIFRKGETSSLGHNKIGCLWQFMIFPLIWKNTTSNRHQDHLSLQAFTWALDAPISLLGGHLGVPDTASRPLIVPLNYLVILHLIQLKAYAHTYCETLINVDILESTLQSYTMPLMIHV